MGLINTLALFDGDLMIAQGGYQLFSGARRLKQDLTLALRDEYGSDRFHPRWGSIAMRYIGLVVTPELQAAVRAEVNRVVQNYIAIQKSEVLRDSQVDVAGRFTTSDVVRSIIGIRSSIDTDTINVAMTLQTLSRETVTLTNQVTTSA